jgi:hypothetical protein
VHPLFCWPRWQDNRSDGACTRVTVEVRANDETPIAAAIANKPPIAVEIALVSPIGQRIGSAGAPHSHSKP